ncbi:MarR family winged helix-turn-helix transcriptional regulator [Cellulomonas hominis]
MRSGDEAELFGMLFLLSQHISRGADEALARHGLTGRQWLLLVVLTRAFPTETPTLSQAAEVYGTSRQNVKQIALQLQARGFVELRPDPSDGRITRLGLTPKIAELDAPEALTTQRELLHRTFAMLPDEQLATLRALVADLVEPVARGRAGR